jgi:hypothetical protein
MLEPSFGFHFCLLSPQLHIGAGGESERIMRIRQKFGTVLSIFLITQIGMASGHGPVFGLSTPTNAQGAWSFDVGSMSRAGVDGYEGMTRARVSYGITEDVQVSLTAPYMFASQPLLSTRGSAMMSASPDFEGVGAWRFQRLGIGVGSRFETTVYGGLVVPGPQRLKGMMGNLKRAPGVYSAVATGFASRSHYLWGGIGYTHFADADGDQRPRILNYSLVWGYRPKPLRKDYPHWDWRGFIEATGENVGSIRVAGLPMPGTSGRQVFVGPSALGIWKNCAIEGGLQFPVYRNAGAAFEREKFRFALNFSYFF